MSDRGAVLAASEEPGSAPPEPARIKLAVEMFRASNPLRRVATIDALYGDGLDDGIFPRGVCGKHERYKCRIQATVRRRGGCGSDRLRWMLRKKNPFTVLYRRP